MALTTDSNPRACALDPRGGTALVLAEGVANLACVGATPAAVVNCLNFGNPEHPEVMWQLSECIDGMAEACRALSLPVIGGNVSLYNESGGSDIDPTPVLGVLGLVDAVHAPPPGLAWSDGDTIVLVGPRAAADGSFPLEGTRWATERRDHRTGRIPSVDFAAHAAACAFVAALVAAQVAGADGETAADALVHAVHDVSGGGLAVALAEMAAGAGTGCTAGRRPCRRALHRTAVALRGGDGRSRRAVPPGCGARDPGRRAGSGGRRPVHPGRPARPPRRRPPPGARGEPGPRPGRTLMTRACARMGGA